MDVPKEQEQALTGQTTVKAKDPKKQEAGRKGSSAEARSATGIGYHKEERSNKQ